MKLSVSTGIVLKGQNSKNSFTASLFTPSFAGVRPLINPVNFYVPWRNFQIILLQRCQWSKVKLNMKMNSTGPESLRLRLSLERSICTICSLNSRPNQLKHALRWEFD
ncbi:Hypothetical predicted protein [Scomber scombrus]|uniref:Uncharacterized protein n=1 Tax=Scomber scombrus TaxID=13677 RepID=A0AAV1P8A5_SCOSC